MYVMLYENVSELQYWGFPSDFLMQSLSFILECSFFCCCDRPVHYGISFSAALAVGFVLVFLGVVEVWFCIFLA